MVISNKKEVVQAIFQISNFLEEELKSEDGSPANKNKASVVNGQKNATQSKLRIIPTPLQDDYDPDA